MNDPTEHPGRSDPRNAGHDQPDNTYQDPAVIDLTNAGDQETQYSRYKGFTHVQNYLRKLITTGIRSLLQKVFKIRNDLMTSEKLMDQKVDREEQGDTGENGQRDKRPFSTVVINFRYKVARRHIEGYAAGQR